MKVVETIGLFDEHLKSEGLTFEAVVIGGAALNVLAIVERQTRDIDCMDPKISSEILESAERFRIKNPDLQLAKDWLNHQSELLTLELEQGWRDRTVDLYLGKAITFKTVCRSDFINLKLLAYCYRDTDYKDCIALKPTKDELKKSFEWLLDKDGNPDWVNNVRDHLTKLEKALGLAEKNKEKDRGDDYEK